jgi:hypothetical protein
MGRPAVDEALAVLRERCSDGPLEERWDDEVRAWCGGLRGVADEIVLAAARAWPGPAFPKITEFLVHLSEVSNRPDHRPAPAGPPAPTQAQLSGLSRKERSLERLAQIRAELEQSIAARKEAC